MSPDTGIGTVRNPRNSAPHVASGRTGRQYPRQLRVRWGSDTAWRPVRLCVTRERLWGVRERLRQPPEVWSARVAQGCARRSFGELGTLTEGAGPLAGLGGRSASALSLPGTGPFVAASWESLRELTKSLAEPTKSLAEPGKSLAGPSKSLANDVVSLRRVPLPANRRSGSRPGTPRWTNRSGWSTR